MLLEAREKSLEGAGLLRALDHKSEALPTQLTLLTVDSEFSHQPPMSFILNYVRPLTPHSLTGSTAGCTRNPLPW